MRWKGDGALGGGGGGGEGWWEQVAAWRAQPPRMHTPCLRHITRLPRQRNPHAPPPSASCLVLCINCCWPLRPAHLRRWTRPRERQTVQPAPRPSGSTATERSPRPGWLGRWCRPAHRRAGMMPPRQRRGGGGVRQEPRRRRPAPHRRCGRWRAGATPVPHPRQQTLRWRRGGEGRGEGRGVGCVQLTRAYARWRVRRVSKAGSE
jgi:hypothetical protein